MAPMMTEPMELTKAQGAVMHETCQQAVA